MHVFIQHFPMQLRSDPQEKGLPFRTARWTSQQQFLL